MNLTQIRHLTNELLGRKEKKQNLGRNSRAFDLALQSLVQGAAAASPWGWVPHGAVLGVSFCLTQRKVPDPPVPHPSPAAPCVCSSMR